MPSVSIFGGNPLANQHVVFRETFSGDGSDVTFQLTSAVGNATFGKGSWSAANILNTYPADATTINNGILYDSINPITRHRISVSSITSGGLVTLDYPPQNGASFYIYYWYNLAETDVLENYWRGDYVASMEGEAASVLVYLYDLDYSNVLSLVWNENDTSDRTLNIEVNGSTRTVDLSGNIIVEATSYVNQDLTTDASPIFTSVTLGTSGATTTSPTGLTVSETPATIVDGSSNTGTDETIDHAYEAFKFTTPAGSDPYMGGFLVRMKKSAGTITNPTSGFDAILKADSAGSPGSSLMSLSSWSVRYGAITTSYVDFYLYLPYQLVASTTYWLVVRYGSASDPPAGATIYLDSLNSGTGLHAYSDNGSAWTVENNKTLYHKVYYLEPVSSIQTSVFSDGIRGTSSTGHGVLGTSTTGTGVRGVSTHSYGVSGVSNYYDALRGSSNYGTGVVGVSSYGRSGYFTRNTNVSVLPVLEIFQDNGTDSNSVVKITGDGTGYLLNIFQSTTEGLRFTSTLDLYLLAGSIILPASEYLNFGGTLGTGGYGIRDNAGVVEYKDSGGSWLPLNAGGGLSHQQAMARISLRI